MDTVYRVASKNNQKIEKSSKYGYYKECIGENINDIKNTDDNIYILNYKIPLNSGVDMDYSGSLNKIFGKCDKGYLQNNKCYIKKVLIQKILINHSCIVLPI